MPPQLKKLCYEDRLKKLELTTLETRRIRGDLIQFYKIINGIDDVSWINDPRTLNFDFSDGEPFKNLRRHKMHFYRERAGICTEREKFFLNRVIPIWNELPSETKDAPTLNSFKARLDNLQKFST